MGIEKEESERKTCLPIDDHSCNVNVYIYSFLSLYWHGHEKEHESGHVYRKITQDI